MPTCLMFSIRYNGTQCEGRLHFPVETSDDARRRLYDETVRVTGQAHRVSAATFSPGLVEEIVQAPLFQVTPEEQESIEALRSGRAKLVLHSAVVNETPATEAPAKPAKKAAKAKAKAAPKATKAAKKPTKKAKPTAKQGELDI